MWYRAGPEEKELELNNTNAYEEDNKYKDEKAIWTITYDKAFYSLISFGKNVQ